MKYIVITSIFSPTEAVIKFSKLPEYKLIVVGDKKNPAEWEQDNVIYLPVEKQVQMDYKLLEVLPYNHYCRKMIGYLFAIQNNAEIIIDTDDDNIPKSNWKFPSFSGSYDHIPGDQGFINIYKHYTDQHIWPRGLPLHKIVADNPAAFENLTGKNTAIGVWQGLADEDPDVDAIYRLTSNQPCYFNDNPPCFLGKGTLTPFNTQNTAIRKELFPLMYLPTYVTFRFTDILRGLIAQPIMWLYGYHLGFVNATVIQKRNEHDFMKDFESEIPMYKHTETVIDLTSRSISASDTIENNLYNTYISLLNAGIVEQHEIKTLEAWLTDINDLIK